jgi:hypothetical protein
MRLPFILTAPYCVSCTNQQFFEKYLAAAAYYARREACVHHQQV